MVGSYKFLSLFLSVALMLGLASAAEADSKLVGTWRTGADDKGQTALVVATPCGAAVCGTIDKVLDPSGKVIAHPNTGKKIFWDMRQTASGDYEGRAFVPKLGRDFNSTVKIRGQELSVRGCMGPVCQSQIWKRVK